MLAVITTGDDLALALTLLENGVPANLSSATIKAAIQDGNGRLIVPVAVQSSSAAGASWSAGIVVCEFTAANAAGLQFGDVFLEIEVTRGVKKTTWPLEKYQVQRGAIQ